MNPTIMDISKRAQNFCQDEENILITLVEEFKSIVECKQSNTSIWKDKEKIWLTIEKKFNSLSGKSFRTAKHLKEKYCNLKKKAKRKFADEKIELKKTGGGTFTPVLVTDVDIAIKNILGSQMEGLQNCYDSDAVGIENNRLGESIYHVPSHVPDNCTITGKRDAHNKVHTETDYNPVNMLETVPTHSSVDLNEEIIIEFADTVENINKEDKTQEEILKEKHDWSTYTPKNLKEVKSKKLSFKKPLTSSQNIATGEVAKEKLAFIKLQKEKFLEEHQLKMEILEMEKKIKQKQLDMLIN